MGNWTVGSDLQQEAWAKEVYVEAQKRIFWRKFMSAGTSNIIEVKSDLQSSPGDRIRVALLQRLTGGGLGGTTAVGARTGLAATDGTGIDSLVSGTFGNETGRLMGYDSDGAVSVDNTDNSTYRQDTVVIAQKRYAVRSPGAWFHQQSGFDFNSHVRETISIWTAEFIDLMIFQFLTGNTNWKWPETVSAATSSATLANDRLIYGGNATTEASITSGDYFTTEEIDRCRTIAKIAEPRIMPIRTEGGQEYYIMVIHPNQAYTLRNDGNWRNAQENANIRSDKNPIFTGALGVWNGVIVYEHEFVNNFTQTGGGAIKLAQAAFLGQHAGCFAKAKDLTWHVDTKSSDADFGDKPAIAVGMCCGFTRLQFGTTAIDYASINCLTAAVDPSGTDHAV